MPTELLDQVLTGQQLAPGINDNGEATRAAALFGRRRSTSVGLTWGYYGGPTPVGYVPHGTVTLTASATNYVQANPSSYLPTVNTTGFTAGWIKIRTVVTDANGATSDNSEVVLLGGGSGGASYTLPIATASVLGGLKIGTGLAIDPATGVVSLTYSYTLPTAAAGVLGGVKVGAGLSIDGAGVLSASAGKVTLTQPATGSTITVIDGKTFTVSNTITLAGTDGTTFTLPAASASLGYLGIPQRIISAAYTFVLADQGIHILHPSADTTARVWTIPANSAVPFPVGTVLSGVNQNGAGVLTIAITTDVMRLEGAGTTGSRTVAANGKWMALKLTATEWLFGGVGVT